MKKKIKKIIFFLILLLMVVYVVVPYTRVEVLTYRYGNQFENEYNQTTMVGYVDYLKVMDYSEEEATIFYVTKGVDGIQMKFLKIDSFWVLDEWNVVWSTSGSADGFIWPYYR